MQVYVTSTQCRFAELKQMFRVPEAEWQGGVWVPSAELF